MEKVMYMKRKIDLKKLSEEKGSALDFGGYIDGSYSVRDREGRLLAENMEKVDSFDTGSNMVKITSPDKGTSFILSKKEYFLSSCSTDHIESMESILSIAVKETEAIIREADSSSTNDALAMRETLHLLHSQLCSIRKKQDIQMLKNGDMVIYNPVYNPINPKEEYRKMNGEVCYVIKREGDKDFCLIPVHTRKDTMIRAEVSEITPTGNFQGKLPAGWEWNDFGDEGYLQSPEGMKYYFYSSSDSIWKRTMYGDERLMQAEDGSIAKSVEHFKKMAEEDAWHTIIFPHRMSVDYAESIAQDFIQKAIGVKETGCIYGLTSRYGEKEVIVLTSSCMMSDELVIHIFLESERREKKNVFLKTEVEAYPNTAIRKLAEDIAFVCRGIFVDMTKQAITKEWQG